MQFFRTSISSTYLGICILAASSVAQTASTVHGIVRDPLGAVVPNSDVSLVSTDSKHKVVAQSHSGPDGSYSLIVTQTGTYQLRATAVRFRETFSGSLQLVANGLITQDIVLATPTLTEEVTVTATGEPTPLAQSGAPITVLTENDSLGALEVQQGLRLVPGVQITAEGQLGGVSSIFLRGGNSDFTKVLLDGVPVNDIGSLADLSTLSAGGISRMEVLRQPSSVLEGADVMSGVVSLSTERGTTPLPLFTYGIDGGNLGTLHQLVSVAGAWRRLDYATGVTVLQTQNKEVNDQYHNATEYGNFGYRIDPKTDVRVSFRHIDTNAGNPNAIDLYGIPDFVNQTYANTFLNVTVQQQTTPAWHNVIRYGFQALDYTETQWAPDGSTAPNPYSGETYGNVVILTGANGYTAEGQAGLNYVGTAPYLTSYPNVSPSTTRRELVYTQSDDRLNHFFTALGSFQYEAEDGKSAYSSARRGNYSYTLQGSGDWANRLFYVVGTGIEDNAVYGKAVTPRASVAWYAFRPVQRAIFSGTKIHASFGKGVEEPSVGDQIYSLYGDFASVGDTASIAKYGIKPLTGEQNRSYDGGVEQLFGNGRARVNVSYFHNEFSHVIEYVPAPFGLEELGLPAAIYNNPDIYGAYVNSLAYRAQGVEVESEFRPMRSLFVRAGYTYLDSVVQRSFSSDALGPSYNTTFNFPTIPIGAYSPLIGARPFRRAPHSGYFSLEYTRKRLVAQLTGTLVGRRDDSTFLAYDDPNYGNSLLLPNRNLDGGYERLALSAEYRLTGHLTATTSLNNLLNQSYYEAFGYPALPFTVRGGLRYTFGGESFRLK
jgi:iron complex outermembrane receptor protein/vitamin B12 transporter